MAETKYTYSIANDTANGIAFGSKIKEEIGLASITIAVERVDTANDVLDIVMKDAISAGEKTTLDGVVAAHLGVATQKSFISKPTVFSEASHEAAFNEASGTAVKNTTTNIDFKMPEDLYLDGGELLTDEHMFGDSVKAQMVDKDGVANPVNTVLQEWIVSWGVHPGGETPLRTSYAGVVPKDMYLRLKYTSVGTVNDVKVIVNYRLHRAI